MLSRFRAAWRGFWGPSRGEEDAFVRPGCFLATLTQIWLYFVADVALEVFGTGSPLRRLLALLVRSEGILQLFLYLLLYVILSIIYMAGARRIVDARGSFLDRISDMSGLNTPYALLGVASLVLLAVAWDTGRLNLLLLLLLLTAGLTWLYCAIPAHRGLRGLFREVGRDLRSLFSRLPFFRRFVLEPSVQEETGEESPEATIDPDGPSPAHGL